ncbi:unnamed protein product [Notodromas monacha]|uniref:Methyltransferase FkbM domain-containing protein n=1 Tax=Notodromas monacha TaxID=399045 RepID=A0A7R9BWI7_9CRUS|nr:unnamed protein product [Notodromas monacha]CAG0923039.1 unnamed protein product [Notodromas monacha]
MVKSIKIFNKTDILALEIQENLLQENRDGKMGAFKKAANFTDPSEGGQPKKIIELFGYKRNGTFLEAGGHDGIFFSNSLLLEVEYGWTGVLVEPQPGLFDSLLKKHRRVAGIQTCISTKPTKMKVQLVMSDSDSSAERGSSALKGGSIKVDGYSSTELSINCYPLISILKATGLTTLDVLFLDVQGIEVDILKTVPWQEVNIKMIVLEIYGPPDVIAREKDAAMEVLGPLGYKFVTQVAIDYMFLK